MGAAAGPNILWFLHGFRSCLLHVNTVKLFNDFRTIRRKRSLKTEDNQRE